MTAIGALGMASVSFAAVPALASTTVTQTKQLPLAQNTAYSCAQAEFVPITGTYKLAYKATINNNHLSWTGKVNVQSASGTGLTSRDLYNYGFVQSISGSWSLVNGTAQFDYRLGYTLTDLNTGTVDYGTLVLRFSTNSAGDTTSTVVSIDSNCP